MGAYSDFVQERLSFRLSPGELVSAMTLLGWPIDDTTLEVSRSIQKSPLFANAPKEVCIFAAACRLNSTSSDEELRLAHAGYPLLGIVAQLVTRYPIIQCE